MGGAQSEHFGKEFDFMMPPDVASIDSDLNRLTPFNHHTLNPLNTSGLNQVQAYQMQSISGSD